MRHWQRFASSISALGVVAAACGGGRPPLSHRARVPSASGVLAREKPSTLTGLTCDSTPAVMCFRDTAYAHLYPGDGYATTDKKWISFGASGDSIEIRVPVGGYIWTNLGEERDSQHNNVPYFRHRMTANGVVQMWISWDETLGDTVTYTLQISSDGPRPSGPLRATGLRSRLSLISARDADRFSIVPLAIARSVHDVSKWIVDVGTYNVALVGDSLYELCRLPCVSPAMIKLTPSTEVTRRY
jgi:hypothetical protein